MFENDSADMSLNMLHLGFYSVEPARAYKIEFATLADIPALAEIYTKNFENCLPDSAANAKTLSQQMQTEHIFLKASSENEVVGFLAYHQKNPTVAEIDHLYAKRKRQGIASDLTASFLHLADTIGIREVKVFSSKDGIPFYNAAGFSLIGGYGTMDVENHAQQNNPSASMMMPHVPH